MSSKIIFVTTGATVIFPSLIRAALNPLFLKCIKKLGYTKLKLQFGKAQSGQELFEQLLSEDLKLQIRFTDEEKGVLQSIYNDGFIIEGFPFSYNVNEDILESNLVISHSGTGSILDSLRLHKKLIVVVNDQLMDNHQSEIAEEFENGGFLFKCDKPDPKALIGLVERIQNEKLTSLPDPKKDTLKNILESL